MLRIHEQGERIPLTIADFDRDKGTITTVFQKVGKTTHHLATLKEGDFLTDVVGPLGMHSHIENFGTVICVGGGVGIAPTYPIARSLKEAGNTVISIIGARMKDLIFWEDKMRSVSDELIVTTDDGSYGRKAVVAVPLDERLTGNKDISLVYAIGPAIMMKFVCVTTEKHKVKTIVSLNSIMVAATGMCGAWVHRQPGLEERIREAPGLRGPVLVRGGNDLEQGGHARLRSGAWDARFELSPYANGRG